MLATVRSTWRAAGVPAFAPLVAVAGGLVAVAGGLVAVAGGVVAVAGGTAVVAVLSLLCYKQNQALLRQMRANRVRERTNSTGKRGGIKLPTEKNMKNEHVVSLAKVQSRDRGTWAHQQTAPTRAALVQKERLAGGDAAAAGHAAAGHDAAGSIAGAGIAGVGITTIIAGAEHGFRHGFASAEFK